MAFGVIAIPGASGLEASQARVNGHVIYLSGTVVTATLLPSPGTIWDSFTMTNYSSDWVRFKIIGSVLGNKSGLLAPAGGTMSLTFSSNNNNQITGIEFTAVDLTGLTSGVSPVDTIPALLSATGDNVITVVMLEK